MDHQYEKLLDRIGRNILEILEDNARISFSALGRKVGLSTPAVTERVRKMEEAGIIAGYHANVNLKPDTQPILSFITLTTLPEQYPKVMALAERRLEILECHHISGDASFVLKIQTPGVKELESLVAKLSPLGRTRTAIVLSSSK